MRTLKDSKKCKHESWEIIPDTIHTTHHSKHDEICVECTMKCTKCHTIATATKVKHHNESSYDITRQCL